MSERVTIVGGGLAGCEAAWQLARRGVPVVLHEMRPVRGTPVHQTADFAELVCSNSLRGNSLDQAAGLLKEEMRRLGSLVVRVADEVKVPGGSALAVDRGLFARRITEAIEALPEVRVERGEVLRIPDDPVTIVATGPLTSDPLARDIAAFVGATHLYFYDAVSPVVEADSIDETKVFRQSRYGKGGDDYVNCPLTAAEYGAFYDALTAAECAEVKDFEKEFFFEGCLPVEVIASRGRDTLRFGPMKPVGLRDPRTGERPYAVVQLRQDNLAASHYSLVGFQTHLKWGEQKRILRMIPGLENAEFVRYGMIHRNTYVNAPSLPHRALRDAAPPGPLLRRADVGGRGLRGVRGLRPRGRHRRGGARRGARLPRPSLRRPPWARSPATSRGATPAPTRPPTSPSACCPSCPGWSATRPAAGSPSPTAPSTASSASGRGSRPLAGELPRRAASLLTAVQEAVQGFLRHLALERSVSAHTVKAYARGPGPVRRPRPRRSSGEPALPGRWTTCSSARSSRGSTSVDSRSPRPRASSRACAPSSAGCAGRGCSRRTPRGPSCLRGRSAASPPTSRRAR